jgi:hypothetical protein
VATRPILPDTGTLADTSERLPDLRPVTPTAAPIEDPAELGDVFEASRRVTRSDRSDFNEVMIRDGYAQIMPALGLPDSENPGRFYELDPQTSARTGSMAQPSTLATQARQGEALPFGGKYLATRGLQERLVADEIRKRRAIDPKFLPGVPDTVEGLRAKFLADEIAKRRTAQATLQRSPGGITGFGAQLAGGAVEAFHDPINLMTLPIGGGGKTILGVAAREALVNGMLELAQQPIVAENRTEIGEHLTAGEALTNAGTAAVGGSVLGTTFHVGGKAIRGALFGQPDLAVSRAYKLFAAMPERIKAKFGAGIVTKWGKRIAAGDNLADVFGELDNRELGAVATAVHDGKLTPDEQSAAHVLERGQDVGESSPFQPGAAGDGAHEAGLAGALKDLEDANAPRPPEQPSAAEAAPAAPERPPAALSTARRPQAADLAEPPPAAIERFIGKTRRAESSGNDAADNPASSADGRFQITDATFRDYHKRLFGTDPGAHPSKAVKNDPATQEKIMAALTHDNAAALQRAGEAVNDGNLYLYHFLGSGDGAKVLKAKPETPIERILPEAVLHANGFLRGKSASETIAWAHAKMGAATAAVPARPGFASTLEAASEDPAIAQLRAEAMQLDPALIGTTRNLAGDQVPIYGRRVKASDVLVDADRFQFKSGGDAQGVTERLNGVEEWDPALAGRVMLWEGNDGRLFAADGHQRVGLAKRISGDIPLDAVILREADGISADEARTLAALKNVAEGTGSAIDAAKVVRGAGADALKRLPPRSALVRDAGAIARLSDEAFGAVYNGVIPPDFAAAIGRLLPDNPAAHAAMVDLLVKTDPANRGQAESIVRQGMAAGFHVEHQDELFGTRELASSLMLERAKVLERGLAELRKMRLVHKTAAENKGALEAAGSSIAAERSAKEAQANAQAAEIVSRLAFRAGPIADALNDGARSLAAGGKLGSLARDFAERIRELNLADLDRADVDGGGRLGEAGEALEAISEEPGDPGEPGFFGELEPQPSPAELEAATERFSDPDGDGVKQQAESLVHDLKADVEAFRGRSRQASRIRSEHVAATRDPHGSVRSFICRCSVAISTRSRQYREDKVVGEHRRQDLRRARESRVMKIRRLTPFFAHDDGRARSLRSVRRSRRARS